MSVNTVTLESLRKKGIAPSMKLSIYPVGFKFVDKFSVRYAVESFGEGKIYEVNTVSFIEEFCPSVQAQEELIRGRTVW